MFIISRINAISGLSILAVGLLLFSQTFGYEDTTLSEGIHSMDYPQVLIVLFMITGVAILLAPSSSSCAQGDGIPVFSFRSCGIAVLFLGYALLLPVIGFGSSSFLAASLCGYLLGWRRLPLLLSANGAGVLCIWFLFNNVLKIPTPAGFLF